ncbi:MAG: 50S ribosomal protein L18 [Myxococcales bacterium]|nr:50S ribosomal protein L18 [Myxococcales bacterium]MCB9749921.1 50S ribosomal protein L18 [Myxococcales bacterium]
MPRTNKQDTRERRKRGTRARISGSAQRPRLTVFRSCKHIYAQVVDDDTATSLAAASTLSKELAEDLKGKTKLEKAKLVGAMVAKVCQEKGISKVVFDRNGYLYHGRIRGVAEGAREAGLDF